jgi:hypothetical protein
VAKDQDFGTCGEKLRIKTDDNVVRASSAKAPGHTIDEVVDLSVCLPFQELARHMRLKSSAHGECVPDERDADKQSTNSNNSGQHAGHTFCGEARAKVCRIQENGHLSQDDHGQGDERNPDKRGKDDGKPTAVGAGQKRSDPEYERQ